MITTIVFSVLSGISFSFEGVFMAKMYRKYKGSEDKVAVLRGLSFLFTHLPVVLWVASEFSNAGQIIWMVCLASLFTFLGNTLWGKALQKLPVGIAGAVNSSVTTLVVLVLSLFLLHESLSNLQYACIAGLIGVVLLKLVSWLRFLSPIQEVLDYHDLSF